MNLFEYYLNYFYIFIYYMNQINEMKNGINIYTTDEEPCIVFTL